MNRMIGMALAWIGCVAMASEPYEAAVGPQGAKVLSGMTDESYVCQRLAAGEHVLVYDAPTPGVLAIRPPKGCQSWVRTAALAVRPGGKAKIHEAGAASRIGRERGPGPAVQIHLEAGEEVQVLGPAVGLWRPIAPPNGEFRYVRAEEVGREDVNTPQKKEGWTRRAKTQAKVKLVSGEADNRYGGGDDSFAAPPLVTGSTPAPILTPPAMAKPEPVLLQAPPGTKSYPAPPVNQFSAPQFSAPEVIPTPDSASVGSVENAAAEPFQKSLDQLEANLARMVAERPSLWQFEALEREASRLFSFAATEEERTAVRTIAARMDRFAVLAKRYRELRLGEGETSGPPAGEQLANAPGLAPPGSDFDAVGTLRPVVSKSGDAPQYALVDSEGNLLTLITPNPDLNLQSLLGRRVAVRGTRGYLNKFQQPHLTASRVSPVGTLQR